MGAKCVSENSTGGKSGTTRNGSNPFETSRRDKPQYFVDVVKEKRTKNNNLEFLIGCHDFPDPVHDTWETLSYLSGSERMIQEFWSKIPDEIVKKKNSSVLSPIFNFNLIPKS